jgi:DNA-binding transcriptional MerR regulator
MMSYTIRQVATQFHMQPSTLRYYEDQGLLTNVERTETGQRIYEDCHIDRLRAICCFKNAGMTIDDLKKFFVYESNEPEHIDEILVCWNLAANPWTSSAEPSTRRPCTCSASFITMATSSVPSTPVKTGRIGASTKTAPIPLNVEAVEC